LNKNKFLQNKELLSQTNPPSTDEVNPDAENDSSGFLVRMFKHDFTDPPWKQPVGKSSFVFVFTSHTIGDGNEELGEILIGDLLATLCEKEMLPKWIFLMNTAVKLGLKGASSLQLLQKLEGLGVKIMVSKTSLYHLGAETELRVGEAVTMFSFVEILYQSEKVLTL
jgi:hypothetical protein